MKKIAFVAALGAVALSLWGCTGGMSGLSDNERTMVSTEVPPAAAFAPAESRPENAQRQVWANELMNRWLNAEGAHSISGFSKPYSLITGWESPAPGVVVLHVANSIEGPDTDADLHSIAAVMLAAVGEQTAALDRVEAQTEDGRFRVSATG
ncbi:hypothetical protein [Arthrobacter rhombi]|nr:hypothetical protein [Arthrobacter rhombi]